MSQKFLSTGQHKGDNVRISSGSLALTEGRRSWETRIYGSPIKRRAFMHDGQALSNPHNLVYIMKMPCALPSAYP